MTVLAKQELQKIFKDMDDEQFTPNGIDLRLKGVYLPENISRGVFGITKGQKMIPELIEIPPLQGAYVLNPERKYYINCGHIDIPKDCVQFYYLRSTFMRAGLELYSSVGDAGYSGDLIFAVQVSGVASLVVEQNERIVQAVTHRLSSATEGYDGDYQNNKIYKESESDLINPEYTESIE